MEGAERLPPPFSELTGMVVRELYRHEVDRLALLAQTAANFPRWQVGLAADGIWRAEQRAGELFVEAAEASELMLALAEIDRLEEEEALAAGYLTPLSYRRPPLH